MTGIAITVALVTALTVWATPRAYRRGRARLALAALNAELAELAEIPIHQLGGRPELAPAPPAPPAGGEHQQRHLQAFHLGPDGRCIDPADQYHYDRQREAADLAERHRLLDRIEAAQVPQYVQPPTVWWRIEPPKPPKTRRRRREIGPAALISVFLVGALGYVMVLYAMVNVGATKVADARAEHQATATTVQP